MHRVLNFGVGERSEGRQIDLEPLGAYPEKPASICMANSFSIRKALHTCSEPPFFVIYPEVRSGVEIRFCN